MYKIEVKKKQLWGRQSSRLSYLVAAVIWFFLFCSTAGAFEIPTGNEDVELRWDNTLKYNIGYRVEGPTEAIIKNPGMDDGDRNFGRGIVTNRVDILSEFDLQYKKRYGFRVSGAGWYDQRYQGRLDNNSVATSNHFEGGQPAIGLGDLVKRYYAGPYGELLDAFVFGKFYIGAAPVNIKVGRHTIFWGEGLTTSGALHGVSYGQMPLDILKGNAVPGSSAKELFRPVFNASVNTPITDDFSIAAQYILQWEPSRVSETGTYLASSDVLLMASESMISGSSRYFHGDDVQPNGGKEWGLSAHWSPRWFDGTIGAYYRRLADTIPQSILNPVKRQYYFAYGDQIDLYGVSLSKLIWGVSLGAELSYRVNMPLASDTVVSTQRPNAGELLGARGNTWHAVLNGMNIFTPPILAESASLTWEFVWNRWDKVTQGNQYFRGRSGYTAIDRATNDFVGFAVSFAPSWYAVFPGVNLTMPLSYSTGLYGNSSVSSGGNEHAGNYSVGLSADIRNKYKIDLRYVDYFGEYITGPTGAVTSNNGGNALLSDRAWISLTFQVTY